MRQLGWISGAVMMAWLLPLAIVFAGAPVDGGVQVSGYVQEWIDGEVGPGVPQVQVSNGRDIVTTDADGRYEIALQSGDTLFVIKPADYREVRRSANEPGFWRHHHPEAAPALRYGGIARQDIRQSGADFVLVPATQPATPLSPLEVLVFGDPQPKSLRDVDYFARDIIDPILAETGHVASGPAQSGSERSGAAAPAQLGVTLGDVVNDDLSLLPAVARETARLGVPWLHASGNHDIDFDAAGDDDSLLSFRNVFGPDTFAWEEPQASFIVLDDVIVQPGQTPAYIGGLRESQFDFLEAYLASARPDRLLVLAMHIPVFNPNPLVETYRHADRERLFRLLERFPKVLLLSAHSHEQSHYFHTRADGWMGRQPLHEYNVGASCGAYWSGQIDSAGIPDSTMSDGTPNGFARLSIAANGDYALRWQVARNPALDAGIALSAPVVLRRGSFPGYGVYANVFMGDADSVVEFRVDDGDWQPMRRVVQADPRVLAENVMDNQAPTLRSFDRLPEATPSRHLWRGTLPTDLAEGEHRVQVRTHDRWRGLLQAHTRYRLVNRQP